MKRFGGGLETGWIGRRWRSRSRHTSGNTYMTTAAERWLRGGLPRRRNAGISLASWRIRKTSRLNGFSNAELEPNSEQLKTLDAKPSVESFTDGTEVRSRPPAEGCFTPYSAVWASRRQGRHWSQPGRRRSRHLPQRPGSLADCPPAACGVSRQAILTWHFIQWKQWQKAWRAAGMAATRGIMTPQGWVRTHLGRRNLQRHLPSSI